MGRYAHRMEPGPDCESNRIGLDIYRLLNQVGKHPCLSVRSSPMEEELQPFAILL